MERTIYLNESENLIVKADGPSLWIKESGKAGRRVPVRLIGKAVIKGNVALESGVITLLVENGVPVCFISSGGGVSAVLAMKTEYPALREIVQRFSRSEEGKKQVEQWMCSSRKNLQRSVLKKLLPGEASLINSKGMKESHFKTCIARMCSHIDSKAMIAGVDSAIEGIFSVMVTKKIIDIEIDPHPGFIHRYDNFGLVKDFLYIIEAEKDRQLVSFFKGNSYADFFGKRDGQPFLNSAGMKNIALRFENSKKNTINIVEMFFDGFFSLIREPLL